MKATPLTLAEIFPAGEAHVDAFVKDVMARFRPRPANDNKPKGRFDVTWFREIDETKVKRYLIDDAFGEREFSVVVGKPGSGKSVIVTDAACHVASGMDWHGRTVQKGLVVYFAAERKELTERRMAAFRKRHGITDMPLAVVGGRLDMTKGLIDAKALLTTIEQLEAACSYECIWVIIDTLSRTFGGGDQNTSKDMACYVQAVDELLRSTRAHITVIHHSGWADSRGKGAIDLDGAVDTSFNVSKSGESYELKLDGANDGVEGPVATFKLESVTLNTDVNGKETTAPIVVPVQVGKLVGKYDTAAKPRRLSPTKELAWTVLRELTDTHGIEPPADTHGIPAGAIVVKYEDWRGGYIAACTTEGSVASRSFLRAKEGLEEDGLIGTFGQWAWKSVNRS